MRTARVLLAPEDRVTPCQGVPVMKTLSALLVVSTSLLLAPLATAAPRMTTFEPNKHGFRFGNTFKNDFVPGVDWRTEGLCAGMSYTALDYFLAKRAVPNQDYRPANRTVLQSYLYNRNVEQIKDNLDKWADVAFNPGGSRDTVLFEAGLKGFGGGRLQELRDCIDRGVPVPLGLMGHPASYHVVLAVGYDLGRYKGDLKANKGDLKIFLCDP